MEFFADLLIAAGAIGLAAFCFVLSRRLKALGRLDSGIGGAIAVLAQQVDDLTRALKAAQATARDSASQLEDQTRRADAACRQLELLMAALHDLPQPDAQPAAGPRPQQRATEAEPVEAGSRPLARWNTNRLHPSPEPDPSTSRRQDDAAGAQSARARVFEPVDRSPERPVKRARARVVRRRARAGAEA